MSIQTTAPDRVRRFIFENEPVRGHWVRIGAGWRELHELREYSPPVRELLGQAVSASVLLASTLKFKGVLTLQLEGNGAAGLLVAQCTHDFRFRAVARSKAEGSATALTPEVFRWLVGDEGRLAVTIEAQERELRYQGVVPLVGQSFAACLEEYFASSEQLPTRLRLAADDDHVAGLLIQKLPGTQESQSFDNEDGDSAWEHAQHGLEAVTRNELLGATAEELLLNNFRGRDVRMFEGLATKFECRCDAERVGNVLRALGPAEVREVLEEQGAVTVTCDFCNRPYRFDAAAVESLFAAGEAAAHAGGAAREAGAKAGATRGRGREVH